MLMDSSHLVFDISSSSSPTHSYKGKGDNTMLFAGSSGAGNLFRGGGGRPGLGLHEIVGTAGSVKRRPFFGTPVELRIEDDYYDEQLLPEKKRRLTPEQVHLLERSFEAENKLVPERKGELATKLGLQPRQVAVWFQNRRARWKTKQLERDFDHLKSSYDSLLADHDSLLADNQLLRSEVVSLMGKLQAKKIVDQPQPSNEIPCDTSPIPVRVGSKAEVHRSTGTGGSLVVDEEGPNLVVESNINKSYYPQPEGGSFHGSSGGIFFSSEDDGCDSGGGFIPGVEFADGAIILEHNLQPQEEANGLGLWVWS